MRAALAIAILGAALGGCAAPPPNRALVVRHPELKCGLVWFSSCRALLGESQPRDAVDEDDAGTDDDAGAE